MSENVLEPKVGQWYRDEFLNRNIKVVRFREEHLIDTYDSLDGLRTVNRILFEIHLEEGSLKPIDPPGDETSGSVNSNEPIENSLPGAVSAASTEPAQPQEEVG